MPVPQCPPGWGPPTPLGPRHWAGRAEEFWVAFDHSGLAVRVRFERDTDGGASPTAVLVERVDGRSLSVRDVKGLPLGEVMSAEMGLALLPWMGGADRLVEPLHDGPGRLSPEHHERVLALLWEQPATVVQGGALAVSHQRKCDAWAERYGERVPESTMRRWLVAAIEYDLAGRERLAADRVAQQQAMDAVS